MLSCVWLCNPKDCSLTRFLMELSRTVQARTLEWVAISCSRGPPWPRNWTHVSFFCYTEPLGKPLEYGWEHLSSQKKWAGRAWYSLRKQTCPGGERICQRWAKVVESQRFCFYTLGDFSAFLQLLFKNETNTFIWPGLNIKTPRCPTEKWVGIRESSFGQLDRFSFPSLPALLLCTLKRGDREDNHHPTGWGSQSDQGLPMAVMTHTCCWHQSALFEHMWAVLADQHSISRIEQIQGANRRSD